MKCEVLAGRIARHLEHLCNRVGNRATGSPGNERAAAYLREQFETCGFRVETPEFACMDWEGGSAMVDAGRQRIVAQASPHSLGFDGEAALEAACTLADLETKEIGGRILLIHGELAKEPLFPKGFVFYNPEEHQRIIRVLEEKRPAALITATGQAPMMAGAPYPFPMFEDGDFDIPSVFLKDTEGEELQSHVGERVRLKSEARRVASRGRNVIATKAGRDPGRIVLTAHFDAKRGTPGALDNASGVSALLAVAELLRDRTCAETIEIAGLNGEDCYSVPGQMAYLMANGGRWREIRLAANVDGVGDRKGRIAFSFYECSEEIRGRWSAAFGAKGGLVEGPMWYQGDHMLFVQQGVPAIAITSEDGERLMRDVIHTERDTVEGVDPSRLVELAEALAEALLCGERPSAVGG